LRLRPGSGEAHLALAEHFYRGYRDHEHALAELTLARRLLPNDPLVFEESSRPFRNSDNSNGWCFYNVVTM